MSLEDLSSEQIEAELELVQKKLERLRTLYEQYFMGIEKMPPHNVQKDVVRMLHRMTQVRIRNTTQKFRLQSLQQRFSSHKAYWARTEREIEEGRYRRQFQRRRTQTDDDISIRELVAVQQIRDTQGDEAADAALAARRAQQSREDDEAESFLRGLGAEPTSRFTMEAPVRRKAAADRGADAVEMPLPNEARNASAAAESRAPDSGPRAAVPEGLRGISADDLARRAEKMKEIRERLAAGQRAAATPATAPIPRQVAPDPAEARTRAVYDRLVETKRQLREPTDSLSYDAVRRSLEKQAALVREKKGCRDVSFDVVVKDGKAVLKATPID